MRPSQRQGHKSGLLCHAPDRLDRGFPVRQQSLQDPKTDFVGTDRADGDVVRSILNSCRALAGRFPVIGDPPEQHICIQ